MSVEELNRLVEQAYAAAFEYEDELTVVYELAYERQTAKAVRSFRNQTITAAWTPPLVSTLSDGMSEKEAAEADRVRNEAAAAILAIFASIGLAAFGDDFLRAISERAQQNFIQEIQRRLTAIVTDSFNRGLSAEQTAEAIREQLPQVIPASAEMLAQTELTALVNERSMAAAQKQFRGAISKTWLTVGDNRVRAAHAAAQGQTVPIEQPFQIGGFGLMYPGDPNGPLRLVARCRCRLSFTNDPTAITAAARPDVSELAMIAVYPTPEEAEAIATAGGNPAETMHVTMVFLGDVNEIDLEAAARAVERVAQSTPPLSGRIGGVGMFAGGPDGFPQLVIPNVQGLATLRTRLTDALDAEGIVSPSEHDWVPHMTLAYVEEPSLPEDMSVVGSELTFNGLSLTVADVRTDFPFATAVVASAQEDTIMPTMELRNDAGEVVGYVTSSFPTDYDFDIFKDTFATTVTITDDATNEEAAPEPMEDGPAWRALLAIEGVETEDGRMLAEGSLTWRTLPLSLTAMDTSQHGAEGEAKVAGRIDTIWRDETNPSEIWGEGVFNGNEFGLYIAELVSNQSLRGNSIEPAVLSYEIRNRETGEVLEGEDLFDAVMNDVPLLTVFLEAVIMASTVVATPAIGDANIVLASGVLKTTLYTPFEVEEKEVLTASAAGMAPLYPPREWFSNPKFRKLTGLVVTDEGRVMGHAAGWDSCHIGEPRGPGICVPPPRSGMSYEIFHHGLVRTEEGDDIPCGPITMSAFHATDEKTWKTAREHYEHSGYVVADVVAGEDSYGIWVSGALRPDIPAERVREFKAGALSGDWRDVIGRGLEFLGALVVNIPGFPIPRPRAVVVASASGEEHVLSLTAAGIVEPEHEIEGMSRREYLRKIRALTA